MLGARDPIQPPPAPLPGPPSERPAWMIAIALAVAGVAVIVAVLTGTVGTTPLRMPPALPVRTSTPLAGELAGGSAPDSVRADMSPAAGAIVARPSPAQQRRDGHAFEDERTVHISRRWMEAFYPIYATVQGTFGVSWLLLASIHMQESAFSTAPGTYEGLNFAHCCGGPMQFNVTDGPVSTWALVSDSYLNARRPAAYDHMTAHHPSIYDDFDALMGAGHLLSADGAGYALDASAWTAAYDYYGHDVTGVLYADQVLARAIGWSQHGFCINCAVEAALVSAVHDAYGAPVQSALEAPEARPTRTHARAAARRHASVDG